LVFAAFGCESARRALRGDVVAEHSGFHFELTETEFHHVADGHHAEELPIVPDDEVPNSLARYSTHDGFDGIIGIAKGSGSHDVLHQHVAHRTEAIHRFYDVSFANEPDDGAVSPHHGHSADVVNEEQTNRLRDLLSWPDRDDALPTDQISNVHVVPPDTSTGYS
jgi:hypothetical protein